MQNNLSDDFTTRFKDIGIYTGSLAPNQNISTILGKQGIIYLFRNIFFTQIYCQMSGGVTMEVYPITLSEQSDTNWTYEIYNNNKQARITNIDDGVWLRYMHISIPI